VERLALHHCLDAPLGDGAGTLFVARTYPLNGESFVFVAPVTALAGLRARILASGDVALGAESDYERLRIEAGMAGPGHELTEDYIPLEAGLWDAVSFTKGCYIGQEIIARMESRNRLAKTLVRLDLAGVVPPGARISADHSRVGTLTSVVALPDGTAIGLGFVKPDRADTGTRLSVALSEAPDSDQITAEVVAAPLLQARH
jgi:aminomethyltransferase